LFSLFISQFYYIHQDLTGRFWLRTMCFRGFHQHHHHGTYCVVISSINLASLLSIFGRIRLEDCSPIWPSTSASGFVRPTTAECLLAIDVSSCICLFVHLSRPSLCTSASGCMRPTTAGARFRPMLSRVCLFVLLFRPSLCASALHGRVPAFGLLVRPQLMTGLMLSHNSLMLRSSTVSWIQFHHPSTSSLGPACTAEACVTASTGVSAPLTGSSDTGFPPSLLYVSLSGG